MLTTLITVVRKSQVKITEEKGNTVATQTVNRDESSLYYLGDDCGNSRFAISVDAAAMSRQRDGISRSIKIGIHGIGDGNYPT